MAESAVKDDVTPTEPMPDPEDYSTGFDDYWGVDQTDQWFLPDGKQYFVISTMNEGERAKFEKENNNDLKVSRQGETSIKVDPAKSRWALITAAVTDWFLIKNGNPLKFSEGELTGWLRHANPKIVDDLEAAIRKFNPWLNANLTVEEIDKEIENLKELRKDAEKREQGE